MIWALGAVFILLGVATAWWTIFRERNESGRDYAEELRAEEEIFNRTLSGAFLFTDDDRMIARNDQPGGRTMELNDEQAKALRKWYQEGMRGQKAPDTDVRLAQAIRPLMEPWRVTQGVVASTVKHWDGREVMIGHYGGGPVGISLAERICRLLNEDERGTDRPHVPERDVPRRLARAGGVPAAMIM